MEQLQIIKIGGSIIDNSSALSLFLQEFSHISGSKILIHGGGKKATELSDKLGIQTVMHQGRRKTNTSDLEVVTMVYAGLLNKKIVAELQSLGVNALGLSGADGNAIKSKQRPIKEFDYGLVGDLDDKSVNVSFMNSILQQGMTPVFCALTHNGKGQLLNTNADTIAAQLSISLAAFYDVKLIYCFEKAGVLRNIEDEKSVIPKITTGLFQEMKEEKLIIDGMIPKIENALNCVNAGVRIVRITHAIDFNNPKKGTSLLAK